MAGPVPARPRAQRSGRARRAAARGGGAGPVRRRPGAERRRPALPARSRVDPRPPNLRTWKCHSRNTLHDAFAGERHRKAKNIPGVQGSGETGRRSHPRVRLFWRFRAK